VRKNRITLISIRVRSPTAKRRNPACAAVKRETEEVGARPSCRERGSKFWSMGKSQSYREATTGRPVLSLLRKS
jgi:hypothetical protein